MTENANTTAGESLPETPPGNDTVDARTFTQQDVDRIVQDRLARVKGQPPADYDDLKAAAARLAEIEESNKTELEKAVARAEAAEQEREQIRAEAYETRLNAAIIAEAAKPDRKVVDTDTVIALLDRNALDLDDNGYPTNIAEAMDSLLKAKPFLVASGGARGNADQGARTSGGIKQVTEAELKAMRPEEINKARKEGRLNDLLGVR